MLVFLLVFGSVLGLYGWWSDKILLTTVGAVLVVFAALVIDSEAQTEWRSKMEQQGCASTQQRGKRVTAFTCPDGVTHFF